MLFGAIPPFLLKRDDNTDGVDGRSCWISSDHVRPTLSAYQAHGDSVSRRSGR
jgi:hypothetical protein